MPNHEHVLVTGGAGMLGLEIVRRLARRGDRVRVLDLVPVVEPSVEMIVGDVRDAAVVEQACEGIDVVHHAAAAVWNPVLPRAIYEEVNLGGTRRVLDACRRNRVRRLVFTSSMDVVVDGRRPIVDGDETLPYPKRLPAEPYSRSKILAERMVLEHNDRELATCVLRPTGMYGPRDKYHLPNLLDAARGALNVRLGNGRARFSHVYCENVAHAHILAADRLHAGSAAAGKCYFITDHKPDLNLFDFMAPFLRELGVEPPRRCIPYPIAYALATLSELFAPRSPFNRFSVVQTCIDHTFVSDRARDELGYEPVVSLEEAFERTMAWARSALAAKNRDENDEEALQRTFPVR